MSRRDPTVDELCGVLANAPNRRMTLTRCSVALNCTNAATQRTAEQAITAGRIRTWLNAAGRHYALLGEPT